VKMKARGELPRTDNIDDDNTTTFMHVLIVRAELKRRECNAMGHAFVCIRRPFEF